MNAAVAGVLAGWTVENVPIESLGFGGWLRGLSFAGLSVAVPVVSAAAMARQVAPPPFAKVVGRKLDRAADPLTLVFGILLLALTVLTVQSALSLAFDPRYRDFPFAPLTAAALPFLLAGFLCRQQRANVRLRKPSLVRFWRFARYLLSGTKPWPTGRRCGSPRRFWP